MDNALFSINALGANYENNHWHLEGYGAQNSSVKRVKECKKSVLLPNKRTVGQTDSLLHGFNILELPSMKTEI